MHQFQLKNITYNGQVWQDSWLPDLIQQLNKDLAQSGCHWSIAIDASAYSLIETLTQWTSTSPTDSSCDLRALLYRIDVSEKRLQKAQPLTPEKLAYLILEREFQKIVIRKKYG